MNYMPECPHPGRAAIGVLLIILPLLPPLLVVNMTQGPRPRVLIVSLLSLSPGLVGLLKAASPSTVFCIVEVRQWNMLQPGSLGNLSPTVLLLTFSTKLQFHCLAVPSNNSDLLGWRWGRGVKFLHLGLTLLSQCLPNLLLSLS